MKIIGVLAATKVDTQMGVDVVKAAGFPHVSRYISENAVEHGNLQVLHKDKLTQLALQACLEMVNDGAQCIFLYCNSVAGSIDLKYIRGSLPVRVITPLDVYRDLALKHRIVAVMAANGQGLAAIERVMQEVNPRCSVNGSGTPPLVEIIETGIPPKEIMDKLGLDRFVKSLCKMGGEILVLGCTHFPYLAAEIEAVSSLPVIDPAQAMLKMVLSEH